MALASLSLTLIAGCAQTTSNAIVSSQTFDADSSFIEGVVLDDEYIAVADVSVVVAPGDGGGVTSADGLFRIGPVEPGSYVITATKEGYASTFAEVAVFETESPRVTLFLNAISSSVPYHDTTLAAAFLDCFFAAQGLSSRCNPVDRVTGQNLTGDSSRAFFEVPGENLANLLFEVNWQPTSATGQDIRVWWEPRGSAVALGGVTPQFLLVEGSAPLRAWVTPGEPGVNGNTAFDGTQGFQYTAQNRPSVGNATLVVAAVYLEQRVDDWFTWFYNRPGPVDFTALPDA